MDSKRFFSVIADEDSGMNESDGMHMVRLFEFLRYSINLNEHY